MPIKKKENRTIKPYNYKRQGKTVKIPHSFDRGYWVIDLTKAEEKALREGKAKQLFEKKSEKAKKMDRSKTAEKVYDKPVIEWLKATGRSDVKGIDTKETKAEKKEKFQKAKKKHEARSEKAKETDERINAKKTFTEPTEEWEKSMNQTDVKGIDTKEKKEVKPVKKKLKPKKKKLICIICGKEIEKSVEKGRIICKKCQEAEDKAILSLGKSSEEKEKPKEKTKKTTVKEEFESIIAKKDYKKIKWQNIEELEDKTTIMISEDNAVMIKDNSEKSDFVLFAIEKAKKTSLRNESIVAGDLYNFKDNPEMTFNKEYVDEALKQLKNPKIYVKEEQPLIIMGDDKTIVIAPLMYDGDIEKNKVSYKDFQASRQKKKLQKKTKTEFEEIEVGFPNINKRSLYLPKPSQRFKRADFEINEIQRRRYGNQTLVYVHIKNKVTGNDFEDWLRPAQLRSVATLNTLVDWDTKGWTQKEEPTQLEKEKEKHAEIEKKGNVTITTYPKSKFIQPKDREKQEEYFTAIKSKDAFVNVVQMRQELHYAKLDVTKAEKNKEPEGRIKYLKEKVKESESRLEKAIAEEKRINALPRKEITKKNPEVLTRQIKSKEEEIEALKKKLTKARGYSHFGIKQEIKNEQRYLNELEIEQAEQKFLEKANYDPKKAESLKKQYLYFSEEELKDWSNQDPLSKYALIIKERQNL